MLEFGRRTESNLIYIENALQQDPGADVHVVTQLTLSLLGIVVFPYEKHERSIFATTIDKIRVDGWFGWVITLDEPKKEPNKDRRFTITLGDFLWHLRNAIAHGGITFNSDSPDIGAVTLTAEDKPSGKGAAINWRARIEGSQLRTFCLRFLKHVDGMVG